MGFAYRLPRTSWPSLRVRACAAGCRETLFNCCSTSPLSTHPSSMAGPGTNSRRSLSRVVIACSALCIICGYAWATREVSLQLWLMARFFETGYMRSIFSPEHFSQGAHETQEDAMRARKADADKLTGMGARILQEDMAEVHDVALAVKGGEVPLRIYVPNGSTSGRARAYKGVLLWIHGGGWMFGTVDAHDAMSRDLAEASRMIVVSVGYRLTPEVKFPGPIKDCLAAVKWAKTNIWAFGGDAARLALVGESSGGTLAIATAMLMGKSWIPFVTRKSPLCAVVAASPPLSYEHAKQGLDDGDGEWRSYKRYWSGYGLEGAQMKGYWDWYLRTEKDGRHPMASPLRAKKRLLKSLPPVLLQRAEHEVLWDEIFEMGRNLADAGQEVLEIQEKSCIHGLFAKRGGACGETSLQHAVDFLDKHCS
ncbi:unnamed protein product [Pylaiella littoralis]